MKYFAEIGTNNLISQVIVVADGDAPDEETGKEFIASLGLEGVWIETSYDTSLRRNFGGVGDKYDAVLDEFMSKNLYLSWDGLVNPVSPSILLDSASRCGNQFFNEITSQAFPDIFQRWGYLDPHNPESFVAGIGTFDMVATIVRDPIDSIASSILAFNLDSNAKIIVKLEETLKILRATQENKENIYIFKFNEITTDPTLAISEIATGLGVKPRPYNEKMVASVLTTGQTSAYYPMPIDNADLINKAKNKLSEPQFAALLAQCTDIYANLLS